MHSIQADGKDLFNTGTSGQKNCFNDLNRRLGGKNMFLVDIHTPIVILITGCAILKGFFILNNDTRYKNKRCLSWLVISILLILFSIILFIIHFIQ